MFKLEVDLPRRLIRADFSGFLTVEDVAEFFRQEQKLAEPLARNGGTFLLLVNTLDSVIQSQEVAASFTTISATLRYKATWLAIVRGGTLTRLQSQRIIGEAKNRAVFATLEEAEAWLLRKEAA